MILITEGNRSYFINGTMLGNTTRSNYMTEYPTIEGTSFSDHYYRELETANFELHSSDVSKPLVYMKESTEDGGLVERTLSTDDVNALLQHWFKDAPRVEVTTLRFTFRNMVLQSYSWSDQDLSSFNPSLTFKEARVQTMRTGVVNNPEQYYQAAYGTSISVNGPTATETPVNAVSVLTQTAAGAAVGAAVGSVIPFIGTGVGAVIGGAIGFFGSIFS